MVLGWWVYSLDDLLLTYHETRAHKKSTQYVTDRKKRALNAAGRYSARQFMAMALQHVIIWQVPVRIAKQHRDRLRYVSLYLHGLYGPQKYIGYHTMSSQESSATPATTESIPLTP